ncbi:MAG: M20/M25/M40 family metallo-hydrolase [Deltaproteobacteria bacterium]|nr:M20/M25/M40 family metallo-hydrolase [Deltaproteobacteria bacterium]
MKNRIVNLLSDLVKINSVNTTLSGGPGEKEISGFVARYLTKLGLDPEIQLAAPDRTNVVAIIPGINRNGSLLLNGHLDTVGVKGMDAPFSLRQEGDRLYGRGTYDMKGSIAVMLLLAEYFTRHPPPISILFTFVADEEDRSTGTEYLVKRWLPKFFPFPSGGIFLEPTELDIGVSHKGFSWYEIEVIGKAAHGSRPSEGVDAILPLRSALEELNNIRSKLLDSEADPLLGHATLHASIIEGGTDLSVIPGRSRLQWERRTLPKESRNLLNSELERVIQAVKNFSGNHDVKGREIFVRPPYEISEEAKILTCLKDASPQSKLVGLSFWSDSALCGKAGIPSVLFGPIGHGAHAADEWVSLKSLIRVYEILKKLILFFEVPVR